MTVWMVTGQQDYLGDTFEGLFTTEEAAERHAEEQSAIFRCVNYVVSEAEVHE